jgi:hypothetical protein
VTVTVCSLPVRSLAHSLDRALICGEVTRPITDSVARRLALMVIIEISEYGAKILYPDTLESVFFRSRVREG